ncbi:hypothetical protein MSAN_01751800 [Mycena sanguinolenta]|uniref:Uncharacterized protein n=1 Tax=Mycena sanguinolenta TaxID=230812 RepID=A0A8H7CTT4_9AGAR|nr:hypothetical protein MSAN_01751800 [Mycena sanguinolenta]
MRVFLWILRETGARDVPSFDRLRQVQKQIREEYGIPSIPSKSAMGNVFFMNDPRAIIAQDWANPAVRTQMHLYPEIPEDGVDMDLDALSPMYDAISAHYYVNELARLKNGNFVVPIRWLTSARRAASRPTTPLEVDAFGADGPKAGVRRLQTDTDNFIKREMYRGKVHADAFVVAINEAGDATIDDSKTIIIAAADLSDNFLDLQDKKLVPQWSGVQFPLSPQIFAHDEHGKTTRFCIYCNCAPSDNPMQSEICGHIGGKGNKFCRKCHVGGTQEQKTSPDGYHALFEPGDLRTTENTLSELKKQVELACGGVAKRVQELQTQSGVKDVYTQYWIDQILARAAEMRRENADASEASIKSELIQWTCENQEKLYSPFLTLKGFDPAADTPVELLHTILLGAVKYIWHITHTPWSVEKKKTYSMRLQATETEGLSIHAIRANYIMQYAGSLIGRQFKTITQSAVFHVHDLATEDQFIAWKAVGELSALLWVPEIQDMAQYQKDLKVAVGNLLDIIAQIDPSKIMTKIKYHLLAHIDSDAVRFGPLIGVMTEIFESFNAVFRYCSIYSNHLAPSRDIAIQLGRQETVKHQLTGGRWLSKSTGDWVIAGAGVRAFIDKHPILQRLVGWTPEKPREQGETKLAPLKRGVSSRPVELLKTTNAARALNFGQYNGDSEWMRCKTVVSESLDECSVGTWVFAKSHADENVIICGRLVDILCNKSGSSIVVIELFQLLGVRHSHYGMPVLARRDGEITFSILPAKNLKFDFNVQHDCFSAKCAATGVRAIMQERVASDKTENFIIHAQLDRFIVNINSFHNPHLVRATISRDLWAPAPLFENRREKHDKFSARLRETRATKAAKRKETTARKRTRPAPASSDDDELQQQPPRKRGRPTQPTSSGQKAAKKRTKAPTMVSVFHGGTIGLAPDRSRRTIKRTARALEAEAMEAESRRSGDDSSSSEDDSSQNTDSDTEFNSGDDFVLE